MQAEAKPPSNDAVEMTVNPSPIGPKQPGENNEVQIESWWPNVTAPASIRN